MVDRIVATDVASVSNVTYRLMCLNTGSLANGPIWDTGNPLGGGIRLDQVDLPGKGLEVDSSTLFLVLSLLSNQSRCEKHLPLPPPQSKAAPATRPSLPGCTIPANHEPK